MPKRVTQEPVRKYLYGVTLALVALAVGLGVVTATVAPLVLAVAAAVLAVPAVEAARSKVTPVESLDEVVKRGVEERG